MVVTLGQNWQAFADGNIDWVGVTATYIGIPIFLLIWLGYRVARKTRFVRYADMKFPALPAAEADAMPRPAAALAGE
jgi:lysine-specific permease